MPALIIGLRHTICPHCHDSTRPIMPNDVQGDHVLCRNCRAEYLIAALVPVAVCQALPHPNLPES